MMVQPFLYIAPVCQTETDGRMERRVAILDACYAYVRHAVKTAIRKVTVLMLFCCRLILLSEFWIYQNRTHSDGLTTDHFSGPDRAVSRMCVCVCVCGTLL